MQPSLDQVVLCLAGGLGEEAVVLHAALHGLVPVDAVVVAAPAAGVVVAAGLVVALGVTVRVVRAADPTPSTTSTQATFNAVGLAVEMWARPWIVEPSKNSLNSCIF